MASRPGSAFLVALGCAALLSMTVGAFGAHADDDDDRYEYRSGYRDDDDDRSEYRSGYRDDDDDDRYEYRSGYRDDDDDDRYEYGSGYRDDDDDDDRSEYRSGYRGDDDDDRYEYGSSYRIDDSQKQRGANESAVGALLYSYNDWGIWAVRQDEKTQSLLFAAGMFRVGPYFFPAIVGISSGTNPLQGSAVWSGDVLAFKIDPNAPAVRGDVKLKVNFGSSTLDVDFTNLTQGHKNLAWRELAIVDGAFAHRDQLGSIKGAFYGDRHQAAAGHFERDKLWGVFGALR